MVQKFDPITLEILWNRLISIVDEADASVVRTAFSSLLRDSHDYACVFTDAKGQLLAQGTFVVAGQAGAMMRGLKKWISMFPAESYKPGDIFVTNDPWLLAGHLNDVCVMSPWIVGYKNITRVVTFQRKRFHKMLYAQRHGTGLPRGRKCPLCKFSPHPISKHAGVIMGIPQQA